MNTLITWDDIEANPILAKELMKHLSTFELAQLANQPHQEQPNVLNHDAIISGIIEDGNVGKMLILANKSNLGFSIRDDKFLKILINSGRVVRASLYGNSSINWHQLFNFHSQSYLNDILKELFLDKDLQIPFFRNPRMDKRLLAAIIGGKSYGNLKTNFDFSSISIDERYNAAWRVLSVSDSKNINFSKNTIPDKNEEYSRLVLSATLKLIKDLLSNTNNDDNLFSVWHLLTFLETPELFVHSSDWLSADEIFAISNLNISPQDTIEKINEISFARVVDFFDKKTQLLNISISEVDTNTSSHVFSAPTYFAPAAAAIIIISNLLFNFQSKNSYKTFLYKLIHSKNWAMRAASYAHIYKKIDIRNDHETVRRFFATFSSDPLTLIHSVVTNKHHRYSAVFDTSYQLTKDIMEQSLNESMSEYFSQDVKLLFENPYKKLIDLNDEEYEAIINAYFRQQTGNIDELLAIKHSGFLG